MMLVTVSCPVRSHKNKSSPNLLPPVWGDALIRESQLV